MTFDIGEAEYVAEGANKGASTVTPTTKTVNAVQVPQDGPVDRRGPCGPTRTTSSASFDEILDLIQPALSRALDFGVFHEINPTGGAIVAAMNGGLEDTTNSVEYVAADKPYVSLDAADALVLADGYVPRDVATRPDVRGEVLGATRDATTEQKFYPDFRAPYRGVGASTVTARPCPTRSARSVSQPSPPNVLGVRRRLLRDPLGHPAGRSASRSSGTATRTAAAT